MCVALMSVCSQDDVAGDDEVFSNYTVVDTFNISNNNNKIIIM